MNQRLARFSALLGLLAVTGCSGAAASDSITGPSPPAEIIATRASALSLPLWFYSWGTVDGTLAHIGSSSEKTCFLSGVAGDLGSGYEGQPTAFGGVDIDKSGEYVIQAYGGYGDGWVSPGHIGAVLENKPVNVHVSCTGSTVNRIRSGRQVLNGEIYTIAPATPNRRCFLESVTGIDLTWHDSADSVLIWNDGKNWQLQGYANDWNVKASGASASAVCVDFPAGAKSDSGTFGSSESAVISSGPGYATVCGLTEIGGAFDVQSWDDGVMIDWPKSANGSWVMKTSPGKFGSYLCVH